MLLQITTWAYPHKNRILQFLLKKNVSISDSYLNTHSFSDFQKYGLIQNKMLNYKILSPNKPISCGLAERMISISPKNDKECDQKRPSTRGHQASRPPAV